MTAHAPSLLAGFSRPRPAQVRRDSRSGTRPNTETVRANAIACTLGTVATESRASTAAPVAPPLSGQSGGPRLREHSPDSS